METHFLNVHVSGRDVWDHVTSSPEDCNQKETYNTHSGQQTKVNLICEILADVLHNISMEPHTYLQLYFVENFKMFL